MQQHREVAKYGKALYAIAEKNGLVEETLKNLKLLYSINSSSADFRFFLQSRRIDSKVKIEILNNIFSNILSSLEVDLLIDLISNDNIDLLYLIIKQFNLIYDHNGKNVNVEVVTAKKMSPEERMAFANKVEQKLNKKVNLNNILEPEIIGGAKFRGGNMIVDGSISNRLHNLEKALF